MMNIIFLNYPETSKINKRICLNLARLLGSLWSYCCHKNFETYVQNFFWYHQYHIKIFSWSCKWLWSSHVW